MIEVSARQTVVNKQNNAAIQRGAECCNQTRVQSIEFPRVAIGQRLQLRCEFCGRDVKARTLLARLRGLRPLLPGESIASATHTQLARHAAAHDKSFAGHGIQHFVGKHHAREGRRHRGEPAGARRRFARSLRNVQTLAGAQIGRHFKNAVLIGQAAARLQLQQRDSREPAGARTQFEHRTAGLAQHRPHLRRDAFAKKLRQFGRRDEVARSAKFLRAGAVVTQARFIQCNLHEVSKRDPAARGIDPIAHYRCHGRRLHALRSIQLRQRYD